jgi:microcystin-dependent protein
MSEPFLSEIRIMGFNFAPRGWALCDGQILPINQNQSLYSLLGTAFGGDGRTTFALPDLRGRVPLAAGGQFRIGQKSGEETHTLAENEMPQHRHLVQGSTNNANTAAPSNGVLGTLPSSTLYSANLTPVAELNPGTVLNTGGGQAHDNMQPYLALNFCIAMQGLFPSRN